uniref:Uncharacterized protein n=1 Tax=Oryza brachyantha TaxID=4533 RepID=J3M256_ORYBR
MARAGPVGGGAGMEVELPAVAMAVAPAVEAAVVVVAAAAAVVAAEVAVNDFMFFDDFVPYADVALFAVHVLLDLDQSWNKHYS